MPSASSKTADQPLPPPSSPQEPPPPSCFVCHAPNTMRPFDAYVLASYQLRVCGHCKSKNTYKYKEITTTNAKKKYLVSDNVLRQLPFVEKANPRNPNFRPMKLYLTYHVEEASLRIWETLENLDQEIVKRAKRKQAKKDAPDYARKRLKKTLVRAKKQSLTPGPAEAAASTGFQLKATGLFAVGGLYSGSGPIVSDRVSMNRSHAHDFGPLTLDAETGSYTKRCVCGVVQEVELM